jgi:drug/metabolite transporter (DMT)-like permease
VAPAASRESAWATPSLLLIAAIWGTTFSLLRESVQVLHPVELMALRFTIATALLAALYAPRLARMRRLWIRDGLVTGAALAVGYLTQVMGLVTISASRSAFLTGTYIPITPFAAYFIVRSRPGFGEGLGVALAFGGLALFSADAGFSLGAGDLWTLGCAASFAVQIVLTNVAARRSDPIAVTLVQLALSAAVAWILVAARGGFHARWESIPWGVIVYLSVIATALVLVLQTWVLGQTRPVRAALIFSTEPIFAAGFAAAFFAERMSARELSGAALILAGVVFSELWRPAREWIDSRGGA